MTTGQPMKGVFCPAVTPVQDDLSPDISRFVAHCQWLLENGCHGLAVFGTTGEANSFSVEERLNCLEALVAAGIEPGRILPGTGCCALSDSVRMTAHATALGCGGVLMLPPFYYKGVSDDGLFKGFAEVIEQVGDARLNVYLYHIPPVAQVGFSLALVERLVRTYPDTVVGLKDSSGDWSYTEALLKTLPGFGAFSGSEVFLLNNLRAGGAGTISATANINSVAIRDLYDRWQSDAADDLQAAITQRRQLVQQFAMIPALKRVLGQRHNDPAWHSVRPPLVAMGDADAERLISTLVEDGYQLDSGTGTAALAASA